MHVLPREETLFLHRVKARMGHGYRGGRMELPSSAIWIRRVRRPCRRPGIPVAFPLSREAWLHMKYSSMYFNVLMLLLSATGVPTYADDCQDTCANAENVRQCLQDCRRSPMAHSSQTIPSGGSGKVERMDTSARTRPPVGKRCPPGEVWDAAQAECVGVEGATPIQLPQVR